MILTKQNKGQLNGLLNFAKQVNADSFRIGRYFPFREAAKCRDKYELSDIEIQNIINEVKTDSYNFKIILPISSIFDMEKGYIVVNFLGEIFLPTIKGKYILGDVFNFNFSKLESISSLQGKIFK